MKNRHASTERVKLTEITINSANQEKQFFKITPDQVMRFDRKITV